MVVLCCQAWKKHHRAGDARGLAVQMHLRRRKSRWGGHGVFNSRTRCCTDPFLRQNLEAEKNAKGGFGGPDSFIL